MSTSTTTTALALTPERARLEQQYRTTCDARDGVATCINTYDQVLLDLTTVAIDLRERLARIDAKRLDLAEHLRQLENEHSNYMAQAYTLFANYSGKQPFRLQIKRRANRPHGWPFLFIQILICPQLIYDFCLSFVNHQSLTITHIKRKRMIRRLIVCKSLD